VIIEIPAELLRQIHAHGETNYPEEGAGFILGTSEVNHRQVQDILPLTNAREAAARSNRYLITPQDMLRGEREASQRGLDIIGVFHSHPDHPNRPSEFDLQWALPWFSYLITSVEKGVANQSRSWRLTDDRDRFVEEEIVIKSSQRGFF
jgi:proteasome lid subunit RPN8/RPN11